MRTLPFAIAVLWIAVPGWANACWDEAGQRYGVSPQLLYAIARVESHLNPAALNLSHRQRTGSYDIGLMQINSSNLPALRQHGISERDLGDACTNIHVGAWLLAQTFARHGVTWQAVGAYNAACTQLQGTACQSARSRYAWLVFKHLPSHTREQMQAGPAVAAPASAILAARVSP